MGWSLRSSRDAALCWYPPRAHENTPCAHSRRSTRSSPSGSTAHRSASSAAGTGRSSIWSAMPVRRHVQASRSNAGVGDREDQLVRFHGRTPTRPEPVRGSRDPCVEPLQRWVERPGQPHVPQPAVLLVGLGHVLKHVCGNLHPGNDSDRNTSSDIAWYRAGSRYTRDRPLVSFSPVTCSPAMPSVFPWNRSPPLKRRTRSGRCPRQRSRAAGPHQAASRR